MSKSEILDATQLNCNINCSLGEIVDKLTILEIKEHNIKNTNSLRNIRNEKNMIKSVNPIVEKNEDVLFAELKKINENLWSLEDLIRAKTYKGEYDTEFIQCAIDIHKYNDKRYSLKNEINIKYNSYIREEKQHTIDVLNSAIPPYSELDNTLLLECKRYHIDGKYTECFTRLKPLVQKYHDEIKEIENPNSKHLRNCFILDLLLSYELATHVASLCIQDEFEYHSSMCALHDKFHEVNLCDKFTKHCKTALTIYFLHLCDFERSWKYINTHQIISGPDIFESTVGFFNESDANKTLLMYDGGGLGDFIMLSRFIPIICQTYKQNQILIIISNRLKWIYDKIFKNVENLRFISDEGLTGRIIFDYHCPMMAVIKYLNIRYENLHYYYYPLLKTLKTKTSEECQTILKNIAQCRLCQKKTYIINWKGNKNNANEMFYRRVCLKELVPLFKIKHINWISITKEVSEDEKKILDENGVKNYGDTIDNNKNNAFEDTITIMKNVVGVISSDTSLVHLSANLDVYTCVMLACSYDWRWSCKEKTNWYPNTVLFKQKTPGDWEEVVKEVLNVIK